MSQMSFTIKVIFKIECLQNYFRNYVKKIILNCYVKLIVNSKEDFVFSTIDPLFENMYTYTQHAYGPATPTSVRKRTIPPEC